MDIQFSQYHLLKMTGSVQCVFHMSANDETAVAGLAVSSGSSIL